MPTAETAVPAGKMRLAGLTPESVVDGPGVRIVVFAQGCPHHCHGCHNPQTWDFEGGREVSADEILTSAKANPLISGITLSGGEPFSQAEAFSLLAESAKASGLSVITYTGYTWEQLWDKQLTEPTVGQLLRATDILIDGPFVASLNQADLMWRGSSNQRIIDVARSLAAGKPVCVNGER